MKNLCVFLLHAILQRNYNNINNFLISKLIWEATAAKVHYTCNTNNYAANKQKYY